MKLSILTATYNRAKYLPKLYESIKSNLKYNIIPEWIIIDDGSTDDTKKIVQNFINDNQFEIKYQYQENAGKMKAINEAVNLATGELIIDCDSDNCFLEDSFKNIEENAKLLLENSNLYGLVFLQKDGNGKISGKEFPNKEITTMFDLYFKEDIQGEKVIVYNSKIRKMFSHELENNEKFITEARMYHKMDEKYKLLTINLPIEQGEYLEDGYSKNINNIFKNCPYGYYMYFKEILGKNMRGVKFKKRIYAIKHFILFGYLVNNKFDIKCIRDKFNKFLYTILYLPGIYKSKKFKDKNN